MSDEYLIDASAIYPLLSYVESVDLERVYVLRLTFYEVGNVIWKEFYLHKRVKDPVTLAELFRKFLSRLKVLEDPPMEEAMKVAVDRGLTFYDASYVYAAESRGLVLVSEDSDLRRKGNAISLKEFLERNGLHYFKQV